MDQLAGDFVAYVPKVLGALAVVVAGIVLGLLARPATTFVLRRLRFDAACDRVGVTALMRESGLRSSPSRFAGTVVFWGIVLFAVLAALGPLGLKFLTATLDQIVLYTPRIVVAALIVVLGTTGAGTVAELFRRELSRLGVSRTAALGGLVRVAIVFISAILAANVLGIQATILILISVIVLGGVVLTAALALGLGLGDLSRNVAAGRYVAESLKEGDEVTIDGLTGTVEKLGYAMTTLRTTGEEVYLLPNTKFLEQAVRLKKPGDFPEPRL